jgi:riboflavin kinase/FMN adenylyltransferase
VRVFHGSAALATARDGGAEPALARPLAVAIGNFDGVHRGHQALIQAARARAAARPGPPPGAATALTFTPHPARVFAPALAPPLIMSLERRLELLAEAGVEIAVVEPFTRELAAVEAEDFVRGVLADKLGARDVVVGYDFSFGRGRRGDPAMLARIGAERGLAVTVVPPVMADGLVCSSTKIREFALEGRVEGAALLLGRPFEVEGVVVRGAGRGRKLGVPTANVAVEGELLPRLGIYAGRARILDEDGERAPGGGHRAAVSVGSNPTFVAGGGVSVEAHLLDWSGDLYGRRLRVELTARLRDEQRFESVEALVEQIEADIARVRALLP